MMVFYVNLNIDTNSYGVVVGGGGVVECWLEWWKGGVVEGRSGGLVAWWSGGVVEWWSDGVVEWRSGGVVEW